ncbi:MAG: hypothetical protein EOO06_15300 [Chitinophagaceae bacterium]|nr:MAG: hypothetical protein EOO06_15300 [Chitinophagaceae bacterium]
MQPAKLQTIRLLNGLVLINNERTAGYKQLIGLLQSDGSLELQYLNLQLLLSNFHHQSQLFSDTLRNILLIEGGKMPYGVKVDNQLYQMLRNMKALFAALNTDNILSTAAACEQLMLDAYSLVLQETRLSVYQAEIIVRQHTELQKAANCMQEMLALEPVENALLVGMNAGGNAAWI